MKKNNLFVFLLVCVSALTGCQSTSLENNSYSEESNSYLTEEISEEDKLMQTIEIVTHGCDISREGETAYLDPISLTVNDVTITRKKGDWYDFLSPDLNDEGNLPEDKAYVVVNVTIEKKGEEEFWMNSICLDYFQDEDLRAGAIELDGTTLLKEDDGNQDIFQGLVDTGESLTTDLVYIINKEEEGENAHFLLTYSQTGVGFEYAKPEDFMVIYLESAEDVWQ